jgi:hypothetical protein
MFPWQPTSSLPSSRGFVTPELAWVHAADNQNRFDPNLVHGETLVYPSTYETVDWLQERANDFKRLSGSCTVIHIVDLFDSTGNCENIVERFSAGVKRRKRLEPGMKIIY